MNKVKFLRIVLILLIIAAITVATLLVLRYWGNHVNRRNMRAVVAQIMEDETEEIEAYIEGHRVIGIIRIPEINLEYPILEETNDETLELSVSRFWGPDLNGIGNVVLAGHNNLDGTMLGRASRLEIGNVIEITDRFRVTAQYEIFEIYVVYPDDISVLPPREEGRREVTLLTCINGRRNRLILRAKQI
ncbi:MAG: sortase [Oscillospiraceae bacterium]|nr:sortase [Oscillospiraceae bacterium]